MPTLSTEPYKGTRDFYPEDQFTQDYIFNTWQRVAESYGYQKYNASILEDTAIYKAKSGDELVNEQTYTFLDRGQRSVTIRPEMTPTVARMVARKRKELAFPLRWYSIPNLMRYEKPQRGRLREHWQLNVDIFGLDTLEADTEIIDLSKALMEAFGATPDQYKIKINSRKLVNYVMENYLNLSPEASHKMSKLIDRKDKMPSVDFAILTQEILGKQTESLLEYLAINNLDNLPEDLKETEGTLDLKKAMILLEEKGVENAIFDPCLMRGFDYYTGIVFEVFDVDPKNSRALFGGGRYDDLVGAFGVEKVSGIGFGKGDVTIRDFLETRELLPPYQSSTQVYICRLSEEFRPLANQLASLLRENGINAAVDYTDRKVGHQLKTADRQKIPFVICVGEDEKTSGRYKLKSLTGEGWEKEANLEELPDLIKN